MIFKYLWEKVDNLSLIYFRILWGSMMLNLSLSYVWDNGEKIGSHFFSSHYHFKFIGFEWIKVIPLNYLYWVCIIMSLMALNVMIGFFTRFSMFLWVSIFFYIYMLEEAYYLNHFYLILIISFLMIFIPLSDNYSIDLLMGRIKKREKAPRIYYLLLRFHICLVYFYATFAKFNQDWLRGEPLRHWLYNRSEKTIFGAFLQMKATPYLISYGGIIIDGSIAFFFIFEACLSILLRNSKNSSIFFCIFYFSFFFVSLIFHTLNRFLFSYNFFLFSFLLFETFFLKE